MDMEQEELQFLGFLGIWRESIKIILTGRNIFLLLGLSLILPLAFLYLLHIRLSFLLLQNIAPFILGALLLILYLLGVRYIAPFCQLANVVSVLEESRGIQALRRSKTLAEGKTGIWRAVSVVAYLYVWFVVFDESDGRMLRRVAFGVVCLVLLSVFMLLGLVLQVVIYLVCKSCNREEIDKSALTYYLQGYCGQGYSLVKSKDMKFVEQIDGWS